MRSSFLPLFLTMFKREMKDEFAENFLQEFKTFSLVSSKKIPSIFLEDTEKDLFCTVDFMNGNDEYIGVVFVLSNNRIVNDFVIDYFKNIDTDYYDISFVLYDRLNQKEYIVR